MSDQTAQLLKALEWRYARKFLTRPEKSPPMSGTRGTVAGAHADFLRLAAVSFSCRAGHGETRALLPNSWGQKQVVDCSHFVVFTARTEMKKTDVDKLIARISSVRGVLAESMTPIGT